MRQNKDKDQMVFTQGRQRQQEAHQVTPPVPLCEGIRKLRKPMMGKGVEMIVVQDLLICIIFQSGSKQPRTRS